MPYAQLPEIGKIESLGVLFTLLPGLLTYLVVRALTGRARKLEATELVLYALAYTLVVHATWVMLKAIGAWIPTPDIVGLSLTSVVWGFLVSVAIAYGFPYNLLRTIKVTREGPRATTWESAIHEFERNRWTYLLLCFKDGRRVIGAARGLPAEQEGGHFCLERVRWLPLNENKEQPGLIVFSADDVSYVQYLPPSSTADKRK